MVSNDAEILSKRRRSSRPKWQRSAAPRHFAQVLGAALIATLAVLATGAATSAQEESSRQVCVDQSINAHMWRGGPSQSAVFPLEIPPGQVDIPTASSRDYYAGRGELHQPSERWQLQFLDANGAVVASSAPTEDVPDGEDDQSWSGSLPSVNLPNGASAVQAIHRPDVAPTDGQAMSVWATGITLCWQVTVCLDADGNEVDRNEDGTCPSAEECVDANGDPVEPNEDGSCPEPPDPAGPCVDSEGNPVPSNEDGTCPETTTTTTSPPTTTATTNPPDPPDPAGPCLDSEGNPIPTNDDGTCPVPTVPTTAAPECTDANGNPATPNADGSCPTPDPAGPTVDPTTTTVAPTGPLPVTGSNSTVPMLLGGVFLLAAGVSLVLRSQTQTLDIE